MRKHVAVLFAVVLFAASSLSVSAAETKVLVSNVHICCKACVDGINKALTGVKGVKSTVDKDNGTVALVADDTASAQAAVDALEGAGYYGKTDSKDVVMKDTSGAPAGKVAKLEVSNIHNCCGKCTTAIDKAIKAVPGVKDTTAKAKVTEFTVTGDFEAKAVVKALNDAGFQATVK
jgi:copper chaperone CopZ